MLKICHKTFSVYPTRKSSKGKKVRPTLSKPESIPDVCLKKKHLFAILTTCTVSFHVQQDIEPDMWNHYIYFSRLHSTGCFNNLDMQYLESPLNTIPLPQTCVSFYLLVKRKTSDSQLLTAFFPIY